jgi:transposase
VALSALFKTPMERAMSQAFDASRSLTALEQDSTIIAAIEMSQLKWLVTAVVPGIKRQPLKKLDADEELLFKLLYRWRKEADEAGHPIKRVVVAYEAGRDGFWLARWLRTRGVEAYVIHPTSIAVSREHRRAKTDRLDTELLLRALLGWLRGEKRHCSMVAIPTIEEEDAKRPNRERGSLVIEQTRIVNKIKAILTRFGIRTFRPKLRKSEEQLKDLHTAEGSPLPENTRAELFRHITRLRMVREQIQAIEKARLRKLKADQGRRKGAHAGRAQMGTLIGTFAFRLTVALGVAARDSAAFSRASHWDEFSAIHCSASFSQLNIAPSISCLRACPQVTKAIQPRWSDRGKASK